MKLLSFRTGILILLLHFFLFSFAEAQQLRVESRTAEFTDYVLANDSLKILPPQNLRVPYNQGDLRYRILEQEFVRVRYDEIPDFIGSENVSEVLGTTENPFAEASAPGVYRNQQVSFLKLNLARRDIRDKNTYLLIKNLRIRVYNDRNYESRSLTSQQQAEPSDHPLASGTWYKIPVTRDGIHQINRDYLQELGISTGSVDPRNIQIWGTNGYELPKPNNQQAPQWSEIPIIVEGEGNGEFNSGDRILFYGNSVNEIFYDAEAQTFRHNKHSYSRTNYVYLTVAGSPGRRLSAQSMSNPEITTSTFKDFIWKEEELTKPESRLRSGTHWFGQQFTPQFTSQSVMRDTLAGITSGSPIELYIRTGARARTNSSVEFSINGQSVGSANMAFITQLTGDVGRAATFGILDRNIVETIPGLGSGVIDLRADFSFGSSEARGWIDFINLRVNRSLTARNGRLRFFSPEDQGAGGVTQYNLTGFNSQPFVMDVTNPVEPVLLQVTQSGSQYRVTHHGNPGRIFFAQTSFFSPEPGSQVANQNLHAISSHPNYIIVTAEPFLETSQELADYRAQRDGLRPVVVTQDQIFHEFSGGVPDPTAIRNFVRHLWLMAGNNEELLPKHLLLFGDTTYDYKGIESAPLTNHVFTFQHYIDQDNLQRATTFASDDFFGFMGENEGSWRTQDVNILDIGIGRLPVQTIDEARLMVEKIKSYEEADNRGDWRTLFTYAADDGINGTENDRDLHTYNADFTAETIDEDETGIRVRKIYQFSYPVENTTAGRRAPAATADFINTINNGTLTIHFSGHGNEQVLSGERLFTSDNISQLNNSDRLTILTTVTCSFGRFDDNAAQSGAERMLLHDRGGAVAVFTTTRVVFTSGSTAGDNNFPLHISLNQAMVQRDDDGRPKRLGDIYKNGKNPIYAISQRTNPRKFILLGDPALRIGLPEGRAEITSLNENINLDEEPVQVRALDRMEISGNITGSDGQINTAFNGEALVKIFDAARFVSLPNPDTDCFYLTNCGYQHQTDLLYNGRVSVTNGQFSTEFIVPKDISYSDSLGRIHVYAVNPESMDAVGSFSNFFLNGTNPDAENIYDGPEIDVYLNDNTFVNGSLTNASPVLLVDIESEAGVNTTGAGVGHEIVAILRNEDNPSQENTLILNDFYESELDDFTRGSIRYPLDQLADGSWSITVRAWDVFNNVGQNQIFFDVSGGEDLTIRNMYNYPNPMHNFTRFVFEHNQPIGTPIDAFIRIYTLSGRPVAQIRESRIASGNLEMFEWNGRDDDNNRLAAGTYLYHVRIRTDGVNGRQSQEKIERLVILR